MVQCRSYGFVGNRCGNPRPWRFSVAIAASSGLYIAVLLCYIVQSLVARKQRKRRSPFFPFNALIITILTFATMVPSDTTESASGVLDQLTKLSGIFLHCVTMNLVMPSVSVMDDHSIGSNMLALAGQLVNEFILVAYLSCSTNPFATEQRMFLLVMLLVFLILVSHSLTVLAINERVKDKYKVRCTPVNVEWRTHTGVDFRGRRSAKVDREGGSIRNTDNFNVKELRKAMRYLRFMVATSNPNHALRVSGLPLVSAILTWGLLGLALSRRAVPVLYNGWHDQLWGCYVRSGYDWVAGITFICHVVAIVVGFLACVLQGLYFNPTIHNITTLRARPRKVTGRRTPWYDIQTYIEALLVFRYHILILLDKWGEHRSTRSKETDRLERIERVLKSNMLSRLMLFVVMLASNLVLMIAAVAWFPFPRLLVACSFGQCSSEARRREGSKDLKYFDCRIEKELEPVPTSWLSVLPRGRTNGSNTLGGFLKTYSLKKTNFVIKLFKFKHWIDLEPPPKSWTLTLAILTKVIWANFHHRDELKDSLEEMKSAVEESMGFTDLVDSMLGQEQSAKTKSATDIVWEGVTDPQKWWDPLNDYLDDTSRFLSTPSAIYDNINSKKLIRNDPRLWKKNELATIYLYEVTWGINQHNHLRMPTPDHFETFLQVVADLIVACLTRLPRALIAHCTTGIGAFLVRERKVKQALLTFVDVEDILNFLEKNKEKLNNNAIDGYVKLWRKDSHLPKQMKSMATQHAHPS